MAHKEQAPYLLGAINAEVVCDIALDEDYYLDVNEYAIELCSALLDIAAERYGEIYECVPYRAKEFGNPEDARGERISDGEMLWRMAESSGAVFDTGLLIGDNPEESFRIHFFPSRAIQYLFEQDWDELEMPARDYCVSHGIGW